MSVWGTPGGGIEPDEDVDAALRRELSEELGLDDFVIGPQVWERVHIIPFLDGLWDGQHDRFYLVNVEPFEPAPRLTVEQLRAENLMDIRWWTQDELAAFVPTETELFAPRRLAAARRRTCSPTACPTRPSTRGCSAACDAEATIDELDGNDASTGPSHGAVARSPDEAPPHGDVARAVLRPVLRRRRLPGVVRAPPPHRRAPLRRRRDRVQRRLLRDLVGVGELRLVRQRARLGRRPVPPAHARADGRRAHPRRRHPRRLRPLRLHRRSRSATSSCASGSSGCGCAWLAISRTIDGERCAS